MRHPGQWVVDAPGRWPRRIRPGLRRRRRQCAGIRLPIPGRLRWPASPAIPHCRTAGGFAQRDPVRPRAAGVDPARIVLWGFSFSGGNIAALLGSQKVDVAAALLLCPMVDGLARVKATPVSILLWLLPHVLADMAGRHNTVPITGPPGSHAAMTLAGEAEGFAAARTPESKWRNEISPGVLVTLPLFRPFRRADRIRIPIWVGRCADDISSHGASIGKLASRAPQATLDDMPGDHFAPFQGVGITRAVESQIAFLRSCGLLPTAAAAGS